MIMKDNRQTEEAAIVREKYEFIKRVEGFASYMEKEYIDGSEGKSLLIIAGDRAFFDKAGFIYIILGDKILTDMGLANLAEIMQNKKIEGVFRMDGIKSKTVDLISQIRHGLRISYGFFALCLMWSLALVGFQIWVVANWITTVSNLLLMAYTIFMVVREIRRLRRQIAELKTNVQDGENKKADI